MARSPARLRKSGSKKFRKNPTLKRYQFVKTRGTKSLWVFVRNDGHRVYAVTQNEGSKPVRPALLFSSTLENRKFPTHELQRGWSFRSDRESWPLEDLISRNPRRQARKNPPVSVRKIGDRMHSLVYFKGRVAHRCGPKCQAVSHAHRHKFTKAKAGIYGIERPTVAPAGSLVITDEW
jgi:hypothetical protein